MHRSLRSGILASFIVRMLYKDILVTHFFTILLLRFLDCFIWPISTTHYRCYFAFCQSALNEYE